MPPNGTIGGVFIHKNLKGGDSRQPASREAGFSILRQRRFYRIATVKSGFLRNQAGVLYRGFRTPFGKGV